MLTEIRKRIEEIKKEIVERFQFLENEVIIRLYANEKRESTMASELLKALSELNPLIRYEEKSSVNENMSPLIIITDGERYGERIRYLGLPFEYEFSTLIDTIIRVSKRSVTLKADTIKYLENLHKNMKIDVFVTTSCPFCPHMLKLAYQFAQVSERVTATGIDAIMFRNISSKWNVLSVPFTVIDEKVSFVGAISEDKLVSKISEALGGESV